MNESLVNLAVNIVLNALIIEVSDSAETESEGSILSYLIACLAI